jgi:hypothetical protein
VGNYIIVSEQSFSLRRRMRRGVDVDGHRGDIDEGPFFHRFSQSSAY